MEEPPAAWIGCCLGHQLIIIMIPQEQNSQQLFVSGIVHTTLLAFSLDDDDDE